MYYFFRLHGVGYSLQITLVNKQNRDALPCSFRSVQSYTYQNFQLRNQYQKIFNHQNSAATSHKSAISDTSNWIWGISVLCYAIIKFVPSPHGMDLTNGNTWVFVIPMAAGLIVDALFQLPMLQCKDSLCWNEDVITQLDLLWVLLSGLIVAFVFTLAFRGVLGIRNCYWGAALVVHAIVAYLIVKALPFVAIQLL